jgi:protein involved in polysaccharide export with SLBB domain
MTKRFALFFLFSCSVCLAQNMAGTPGTTRQTPGSSQNSDPSQQTPSATSASDCAQQGSDATSGQDDSGASTNCTPDTSGQTGNTDLTDSTNNGTQTSYGTQNGNGTQNGYSTQNGNSTQNSYGTQNGNSTQNGNGTQNSNGPQNSKNIVNSKDTSTNVVKPPAVPRATRIPSEFEVFVKTAVGHTLPVYAQSLFAIAPSTFAPLDHVPAPANYIIGPGDELQIQIWGMIELKAAVTVDRSGQISLPKVGVVTVAGLRYDQLQDFLRAAVGRVYKNFDLNVTLGHQRTIQVYVLGNAQQPGLYTLSSFSTLVDALFTSGGPAANGSMRHVQLRRGNRVVTEFDIYDLQQKGDRSHDAQLLPGDVIYIPTIGPRVALDGSVNQPGIYELKNETSVGELLEGAGGLSNLARPERVVLERIENHQVRQVDNFALDAAGMQRPLKDGDVLRIAPISQQFENAIMLRGNVALAGRYPWHEGMRISDLIPSREALITRQHWVKQNKVVDKTAIDMTADLNSTNAEINWDYASIERLDDKDLSTRLFPFNLGKAISHPEGSDNAVLKAGDIVTIFSRKDLPISQEKHQVLITLNGEFNAPGVYRAEPGETLRDLVERAGGLASHAYLYAGVLTRESVRKAQQEQLTQSINQIQREISSRYATAKQVSATDTSAAQQGDMQAMIDQLSMVKPTGRVILSMRGNASTVKDIPAFPLEDGDTYYVPARLSTVSVSGAVYNQSSLIYQPHKRVAQYLNDAGGGMPDADMRRVFLMHADGTLVSAHKSRGFSSFGNNSFERMTLMPGDAIVVPQKLKMPGFWTQLPGLIQTVGSTATTAFVLASVF